MAYCDIFAGRFGYYREPMNPPPAENDIIQFALTTGCSWSYCTYCTMYGKGEYRKKTPEEFESHVNSVLSVVENLPGGHKAMRRIFIGGGDALGVNTDELLAATQYALLSVKRANGGVTPSRLAIYGSIYNIAQKSRSELSRLKCGGTCSTTCSYLTLGSRNGTDVVYIGLESGNDQVLRISGKRSTGSQALEAGEKLRQADIRASMMVMPGLGGMRYFSEHVDDTVRVLNVARPQWLTFMGLQIAPNTPYDQWIENEERSNSNRRLNIGEIVEQTALMMEGIDFPTTVGIYGKEVHFGVEYNPVPLGTIQVWNRNDTKDVADHMRTKARQLGIR